MSERTRWRLESALRDQGFMPSVGSDGWDHFNLKLHRTDAERLIDLLTAQHVSTTSDIGTIDKHNQQGDQPE